MMKPTLSGASLAAFASTFSHSARLQQEGHRFAPVPKAADPAKKAARKAQRLARRKTRLARR